jgi:hypothetical protein
MRSGKLSEEGMDRVLREQQANPDVPFGTLAVRLGLASVAEVIHAGEIHVDADEAHPDSDEDPVTSPGTVETRPVRGGTA